MNLPAASRRLPALLLLLALLVSQWGWITHEYQAHDNGAVCEMCVAGAQLGHGLTGSQSLSLDQPQGYAPTVSPAPVALFTTSHTPLQPRAPPLPSA